MSQRNTIKTLVGKLAAIALYTSVPAAAATELAPGTTRVEDAVHSFGPPAARYEAWLTAGRLDPFVGVPTPESLRARFGEARAAKREVVEVEVLEWHRAAGLERAKLVFRAGTLWYAVLPGEDPVDRGSLERALGPAAVVATREHRTADVVEPVRILAWPDRGIAYAITLDGARKLVFPPSERSDDQPAR